MKLYHVTFLSNIIKGFDKYKLTFDKDLLKQSNKELKYSQLFLLKESDIQLGINQYENLLTKYGKDNDSLIILESIIDDNNIISNDVTGTGVGYYNKNIKLLILIMISWLKISHLKQVLGLLI